MNDYQNLTCLKLLLNFDRSSIFFHSSFFGRLPSKYTTRFVGSLVHWSIGPSVHYILLFFFNFAAFIVTAPTQKNIYIHFNLYPPTNIWANHVSGLVFFSSLSLYLPTIVLNYSRNTSVICCIHPSF